MFREVGDLRVYCEVQGKGDPLILVHGGGADSQTWEEMIPYLARAFTVHTLDLRGFGKTIRPAKPALSFDLWVDDLVAFMDIVGIGKASLVGWSLGGTIALHLASLHRRRVCRLVVMGTPSPLRTMDLSGFEHRRRLAEGGASIADIIEETFPFTRAAFSPHTVERNPQALQKMKEALLRNEPTNYAEMVSVLASISDLASELPGIDVPTLLIVGDADRRTPIEMSEDLNREIESSYLKIVPRCGHYYGYEQPELTSRITLQFLQDHHA